MQRLLLLIGLAAPLAGLAPGATAGDAERGASKSVQCVACHGIAGLAPNPTFPHLAGQNAGYLELQLTRFRSGERYHPLMSPIAQSLSGEDVDDLAIYYSRLGPLAEAPNIR